MAKNNAIDNENILIKVDQNNLVYIDPNSVIDSDGNIGSRNIRQEEMVMYANLEADLVPRSILVSDNDKTTLTSIAKGTINFLKSQGGRDFDTSWTNAFSGTDNPILDKEGKPTGKVNISNESYDNTAQSFGIDSIQVTTKGINAIPTVNISFIDVRGKTLFESPENSPYNAFFHIPWPIFYLTLKGYIGKAIRYRLHLVKFSSKYNDQTGNFEISTSFVGSTYAYMTDIPLKGMLNCPYMYAIDSNKDTITNNKDGTNKREISKSSKGYSILKSVYSEYKRKGLVPPDFPVKTLRELITISMKLDTILEKQILDQVVDKNIFVAIKEYEKVLNNYESQVSAWGNAYLTNEVVTDKNDIISTQPSIVYARGYKLVQNKQDEANIIDNKNGTLNYLILQNYELISKAEIFTNNVLKTSKDSKTGSPWNFGVEKILINKPPKDIKQFYIPQPPGSNTGFYVKIDKLLNIIRSIKRTFNQEKEKLQKDIEVQMNTILKQDVIYGNDKKTPVGRGFGFDPTIRNIFAIVLANAEVYIRLMKDVHTNAINVGEERSKRIKQFTSETTKNDKPIYPWPEIKKKSEGQKHQVIAYPAEEDLIDKLGSNDYILWPEVEFVEDYIEVATNKADTNADKETGVNDFNLSFSSDEVKDTYISVSSVVSNNEPYLDKSPSSFLYEIYERAHYFNLYDTYKNETLLEQSLNEYKNIKESISEDVELNQLLLTRVKSVDDLTNLLRSYSPFDRYPYYIDKIPTIPYLKDVDEIPFSIEKYKIIEKPRPNGEYEKLINNLNNYVPEDYRLSIYPFNSQTYLTYIDKKIYDKSVLKINGMFEIDLAKGYIVSKNKMEDWFQTKFLANFFKNKLIINQTETNILNTPYFHKQLLNDFNKEYSHGKYAGSAYLLINSIPFKELYEELEINGSKVIMANLFKEISATHILPYHLLVKWGSIYHRYKNYILNGTDILDGVLDLNNKTIDIDGNLFFNNLETGQTFTAYTITNNSNYNVVYTNNKDFGVHPFYDAVFHEIVNGYNHYDVLSGNTSFSANTANGIINYLKTNSLSNPNLSYWTGYVDNSKFDNDEKYTLLPSVGKNAFIDIKQNITTLVSGNKKVSVDIGVDGFIESEQNYYRLIWENEYINDYYSGKTFPSYDRYFKCVDPTYTGDTKNNAFSLYGNHKKLIDLIGTFSPKILDEFEEIFLQFSSEILNGDSSYNKFSGVNYLKFQDLLKDIVTVPKESGDSTLTTDDIIKKIKTRQSTKLEQITQNLLSSNNQIKFTLSNPKEINSNLYDWMTKTNTGNTLSFNNFFQSQLNNDNRSLIKLYIGEDIDGYYEDFFIVNDIELSEENIILFRPLILTYAGISKTSGTTLNSIQFSNYINEKIYVQFDRRFKQFLGDLINKFRNLSDQNITKANRIISGYNNAGLKLENYNFFKSFNDKWIGGNSIGQRLLLEEFLFLDKANKDIGNEFYLNVDRLKDLMDPKNEKLNLYSVISMMIQGTGLDMKPLPAYVNYYGTNYSNKSKITPSKSVAKTLFGTFLEVDYQEASPKIIIQYVGPVSKTPDDMGIKFKYANDTFDMGSTNNNPIIITIPEAFNPENLFKSNKCVAFEVSFGDQAQGIFKGVQLDQASIKNTSESFAVLENIARSESGAGAYNVDIGLFDYYRQASYTCEVTCLGNALIQPTMFFYLKNIPMFRGSYWIYEVNHSIRSGNFTTTFKGTRIPRTSLPDPKDSFVSSYRTLFDRIINNITAKIEQERKQSTETTVTIEDPKNNFSGTADLINKLQNEDLPKNIIKDVNITDFGIPYNGYLDYPYILYVEYNKKKWLRTLVVEMGGPNYNIEDGVVMSLASSNDKKVIWSEIKENSSTDYFYASQFVLNINKGNLNINAKKVQSGKTNFLNPKNNKPLSIEKYTKTVISNVIHLNGQVHIIPKNNQYGLAMSKKLMKELNLIDGDVVYFEII